MPNPVFTYILNIWFVNTFCTYTQLNDQIVLFLSIQSCINHLFALSLNVKQFYLTHRSGATTPGYSEPGSNGNEGVLHSPQSTSITGASPSDCLVSYPKYLPFCRDAVGVFLTKTLEEKKE